MDLYKVNGQIVHIKIRIETTKKEDILRSVGLLQVVDLHAIEVEKRAEIVMYSFSVV